MIERFGLRSTVAGLMTATVVAVAVMALLGGGPASANVSGAVNTTDDPQWNGPNNDGLDATGNKILGAPTQPCLNGPASPPRTTPAVNCNIYNAQTDVFLSGSPTSAALEAGTYFFVVLDPGGQPDPNDATGTKILSTDAATNREFSADGSGGITPLNSSHAYDGTNNVLQVAPFNDTSNHGGEYILAVCQISTTQSDYQDPVPTVDPHNCKYDAFKVPPPTPPCPTCGPNPNADLQVTKSVNVSFNRDYDWSVNKTQTTSTTPIHSSATSVDVNYQVQATWTGPTDSGWDVSGTIAVTNPNGNPFDNVDVTDQITYNNGTTDVVDPNVTCTIYNPGTTTPISGGQTIPANSEVDYPYDCSYSSPGPASTLETNTANVAWDATANHTPDSSADYPVPFVWDTGDPGNPTVTHACTTVQDKWSSTTTTTTLGTVCVDGSTTSDLYTGSDPLTNFNLSYNTMPFTPDNPQNTWTFTYTRSVPVVSGACTEYDNTATVSDDATSGDNSSMASVNVCSAADLTASKTAGATWVRDYDWSVKKTQTTSTTPIRSTATSVSVNYKVQATWKVASDTYGINGTITVTNPNPYAVTGVAVTDTVYSDKTTPTQDTNAVCTVRTGQDTALQPPPTINPAGDTIPKNDSVTYPYSCTYSATPTAGTTEWNRAHVTWDASNDLPDNSADSAYVSFTWPSAPTSTTHNCTTVTDSYGPHSGTPPPTGTQLGVVCADGTHTSLYTGTTPLKNFSATYTLTATSSSPAKTWTFLYTRTVPVTPGACNTYDNTATVTDGDTNTDNSSKASVEVCGPVLGGLTMGFWQNKNGQGLITNTTYSGSTCSLLRTYLTGFNPFKDFPGTKYGATCAGIASYVSDVIKAATCSSTTNTCNSMLKAQMLATALDVFFSEASGDPLKGFNGNIGGDLGGLTIDLTAICSMTDGTGGATCGGSENATSAFPGLGTCVSISTLLGFSNQSQGTNYTWGNMIVSNSGGTTWYNQKKPTQVLAKDTFDTFNNQRAFACP
jgi:hypothetical protein